MKGPALAPLCDRLGHHFVQNDLLARALTHPSGASAARPDNQRLEFLGDRVLGLVIAEALTRTFPAAPEGELAPRLNALVRRETLAEVAEGLDLGQYLRLGRSESLSGGRRKAAILADAMEAVIAAVYLDGGLLAADRMILRLWGDRIERTETTPADAKTRLQEWAQSRGLTPPHYVVLGRSGPDHAPVFQVRADLGAGQTAEGSAKSKKQAEQAAAAALLAKVSDD